MKLNDYHIGFNFLFNHDFLINIINRLHKNGKVAVYLNGDTLQISDLLQHSGNKTYYITESVLKQLDLLKIRSIKDAAGKDVYDWSVFSHLPNKKVTLLFQNNTMMRIVFHNGAMFIGRGMVDDKYRWDTLRDALWDFKSLDARPEDDNFKERVEKANQERDLITYNEDFTKDKEETFTYKVLCFMFLSDNIEEIVKAGERHGTKKSGKIVNESPLPITVVTSKWNVTSIRTEGFDVSGHFRLQPVRGGTQMIFIQPFRKHGYIRKAKSIDNL